MTDSQFGIIKRNSKKDHIVWMNEEEIGKLMAFLASKNMMELWPL